MTKFTDSWSSPLRCVLLSVAVCLLGGCATTPEVDNPTNILLFSIDTLRADRAYSKELFEYMASARFVRFAQAITTAPLTRPAHSSMLTGLNPLGHGILGNQEKLAVATIVPQLSEAGYRTGAFLSSRVLDGKASGLSEGFGTYDDRWGRAAFDKYDWLNIGDWLAWEYEPERSGIDTIQAACDWVEAAQGPQFAWVHIYEPHAPYSPPAGYWPKPSALIRAKQEDARLQQSSPDIGVSREEMRLRSMSHEFILMYDSEVRWTDKLLTRLMKCIDDDWSVIVVADHGESLTEHNYFFNHGARLYEPSLSVPLWIRDSRKTSAAKVSDALVSVQRVAPTILDLAGIATGHGHSLARNRVKPDTWVLALTPGQQFRPDDQTLLARFPPSIACRGATEKFIMTGEELEWYSLTRDPKEKSPVGVTLEQLPNECASYFSIFSRFFANTPDKDQDRSHNSESQTQELRAIGYME